MKHITSADISHDSVEYSWIVSIDEIDTLRSYRTNEGKFDRNTESDGTWNAIDTALNTENTYTLTPPPRIQPVLEENDYLVDSYSESGSVAGNKIEVDIGFAKKTERSGKSGLNSDTQASNEWLFEFVNGDVATPLVNAANLSAKHYVEFEMRVEATHAEVVVWSLTRTDAASEEPVEDGNDFVRDNTDSNLNTITVTRPPDMSTNWLPNNGDYIVTDWGAEYDASLDVFDVSMTAWKV